MEGESYAGGVAGGRLLLHGSPFTAALPDLTRRRRRPPGRRAQGLVVRDRADAETLEDYKLPYAQDRPPCDGPTLLEAVQTIKPTVLIGLSDDAPPHAFSREVSAGAGTELWGSGERCDASVLAIQPSRSHPPCSPDAATGD